MARIDWQDEEGQNLNRYKLTPVEGEENVFDLERRAKITKPGTPMVSESMARLVQDEDLAGAIPSHLTATLPADSWQPITVEIQAQTDPDLMVMQTLAIPGLTPTTQVRITNVPVVYVMDGHPPLWADNIDNTGYILATEAPTVDVTVTLLVQEVTLL